MKNFLSVHDVEDPDAWVSEALALKQTPFIYRDLGRDKTVGLIFLNPSLRTRLSTQKAAQQLGMQVIVLNANQDSWVWEFEDGVVMNGSSVEHIKDAVPVIAAYCDIVAIRSFPALKDRDYDYGEVLLQQFVKYCSVPVISLESATLHPLQSFADLMTIREHWSAPHSPKVVLSWAPHVKALPQAVANSFSQWMLKAGLDLHITHPKGYELSEAFTQGANIEYDQDKALKDADFVYVKNWSAYHDYGSSPVPEDDRSWMLNLEKLLQTRQAKVLHCLPVRRNVELSDEVLDSAFSLVKEQALNRVFAAQCVLKKILETF